MFHIEMLPAAHGDCLWIEYGVGEDARRILIDGGPAVTYKSLRERILHLPEGERRIDLLVVTHIDADHIEGVIRLLQDAEDLELSIGRIWFNGFRQLKKLTELVGGALGGTQGEFLEMLIADLEERTDEKVHNLEFEHGIVAVPEGAELPVIEGDWLGDCRLTLLGPSYRRLVRLKTTWEDEVEKAGYRTGDYESLRRYLERQRRLSGMGAVLGGNDEQEREFPETAKPDIDPRLLGRLGGAKTFGSDDSVANGSSIVLLLEYPASDPQVRFLLAGDAWPAELESAIHRLRGDSSARLQLTGFKLPHHGSMANLTESLLATIRCKHYLISTSGVIFGHPDPQTIDLIREHQSGNTNPRFHFNYMTGTTEAWAEPDASGGRKYVSFYPKGLTVDLDK